MNLLEHYIKEVHSVEDVTNEFEESNGYPSKEPMLKVKLCVDCYGIEKDVEEIFFLSQWEEAKKNGYYMA